ncbi:MAG: response regulator, partial [Armatimonadota bacterium]
LVITDYDLPQMNGMQVAKTIKSLSPSTPIIMLSGWEPVSSADSDSLATVDFLLNKPVTNQELRSAIKQVMTKRHS